MKLRSILICTCILSACGSTASALTFTGGAEFYRMCGGALGAGLINHNLCHGFVQSIAAQMANSRRICLPAGLPERNTIITVQDYMREHPERLVYPANVITGEALERAYPCRWRR